MSGKKRNPDTNIGKGPGALGKRAKNEKRAPQSLITDASGNTSQPGPATRSKTHENEKALKAIALLNESAQTTFFNNTLLVVVEPNIYPCKVPQTLPPGTWKEAERCLTSSPQHVEELMGNLVRQQKERGTPEM